MEYSLYKKLNKRISKLKQVITRNNLFFKNLSYLSVLEGVNILVPFIVLPYLLHVLGKEIYGLIIFAQATVTYLAILQNFGVNTLAVKETSINRDNKILLSRIVSNVFVFKGLLFIISFVILWIVISFFSIYQGHEVLLFLTMYMCFGDFIFPKWYFQGIERMQYITYLNILSKIIILILIFTLINTKSDYLMLPIIYGIGALISGIASIVIIFKFHRLRFVYPSCFQLKNLIKRSMTFFISDVSISIFANSNKIIIGSFLGMAELAYYDLADKIIMVFKNIPLNIVRNTIYPRVAITKNIKFIKRISILMGSYSVFIIILIQIFAPAMVVFLGGDELLDSANVLRVFSISIFTTHISNYYITVGLWSLGYEKIFRNLMIYSTLVFLLLYLILWALDIINIYTITALPALVDIYLIIHTYLIYKQKKLI